MNKLERFLEKHKLVRMTIFLILTCISWEMIGFKAVVIILLISIYDELLTRYIEK
jgi:hypothetical protein